MAHTVATAPALSAQAARRIIVSALASRADLARRTAASRRLAGHELADQRAAWRGHMRDCRELADRVSAIDPADLAELLRGAL